jgi:endonuclease YncB( thermonuclease family)
VLVLLVLFAVPVAGAGDFTRTGKVVHVVDGDTIYVRLDGGATERVRVIGIDTPEVGDCQAAEATAATRSLADGRRVSLVGDPTQATRDRYGRLLAYVWLPGGRDLGYQLVADGHARVYVYGGRPFKRVAAYEAARVRAGGTGIWRCGRTVASTPRTAVGGACEPGYSPCLPVTGDLDCGQLALSQTPVRVTGSDPYRLDGDGDGFGCE